MDNEEFIRVHQKECLYQVVHCPADECNWCGVMKTLTDHIYVVRNPRMCWTRYQAFLMLVCGVGVEFLLALQSHKSDLNIGNDLIYVMNRRERDAPFTTYFQLHEGTIFVITIHVNEKKCIAAMQVRWTVVFISFRIHICWREFFREISTLSRLRVTSFMAWRVSNRVNMYFSMRIAFSICLK